MMRKGIAPLIFLGILAVVALIVVMFLLSLGGKFDDKRTVADIQRQVGENVFQSAQIFLEDVKRYSWKYSLAEIGSHSGHHAKRWENDSSTMTNFYYKGMVPWVIYYGDNPALIGYMPTEFDIILSLGNASKRMYTEYIDQAEEVIGRTITGLSLFGGDVTGVSLTPTNDGASIPTDFYKIDINVPRIALDRNSISIEKNARTDSIEQKTIMKSIFANEKYIVLNDGDSLRDEIKSCYEENAGNRTFYVTGECSGGCNEVPTTSIENERTSRINQIRSCIDNALATFSTIHHNIIYTREITYLPNHPEINVESTCTQTSCTQSSTCCNRDEDDVSIPGGKAINAWNYCLDENGSYTPSCPDKGWHPCSYIEGGLSAVSQFCKNQGYFYGAYGSAPCYYNSANPRYHWNPQPGNNNIGSSTGNAGAGVYKAYCQECTQWGKDSSYECEYRTSGSVKVKVAAKTNPEIDYLMYFNLDSPPAGSSDSGP